MATGTWLLICGHLAGFVHASKARRRTAAASTRSCSIGSPTSGLTRNALAEYLRVRTLSKSEADKLLSRWLKPHEKLLLRLIDPVSEEI